MKKIILTVMMAGILISCSTSQKIKKLNENQLTADIAITESNTIPVLDSISEEKGIVHLVKDKEDDSIIMRAIKDENGEMVATDVIQPAKVTARFKNVAERNGQVTLTFDLSISREMLDSHWQLRIHPQMEINGKMNELDSILITGMEYRKTQLKGYQQYERFIRSIISDSLRFINADQLEIFIQRNLPEIYHFKKDSSVVPDEKFESCYGITEKRAIDHYTNQYLVRQNARKISRKNKMYHKYIKVPIVTEGLRLDTVMTTTQDHFVYRYSQTFRTQPGLRKATIWMNGSIYEGDQKIYSMPAIKPLTFYISSLTSFIDWSEHYLVETIHRRAEANTACYLEFASGDHRINTSLGYNQIELERIKTNLKEIADNEKYDLDSIVVTASCSPEGSFQYNGRLSDRRAESISCFINQEWKHICDSISSKIQYDLDGKRLVPEKIKPVQITYRSIAENWKMLDHLVTTDKQMTTEQKEIYFRHHKIRSLDQREKLLQKEGFYPHLRKKLYPRVRTVLFQFHLHRKDMIQDTVQTTQVDTIYRQGLQALSNRDYDTAIRLLRSYSDFNTALAYCALDYNNSALAILEKLKPNNKVKYLLAIIYSRIGKEQNAIRTYLEVCQSDRSYINRGNLDPEISILINKYHLNNEF